jgi:nicotinate-nucleotide adenylyltransferase
MTFNSIRSSQFAGNLSEYATVITNDYSDIKWNNHINIAVYVGTFDPPHLNHKMVVESVFATGFIDAVIIVPTYKHCCKNNISSFDDRFNMLLSMFENTLDVAISPIEKELCELHEKNVNYTHDTLTLLNRQLPNATLYLTIGSDLFESFSTWDNVDMYLNQNIIVVCRDKYPIYTTDTLTEKLLDNNKLTIIGKDMPLSNINSTTIRVKIADDNTQDLIGIVPASLLQYISNKSSLLDHYKKNKTSTRDIRSYFTQTK